MNRQNTTRLFRSPYISQEIMYIRQRTFFATHENKRIPPHLEEYTCFHWYDFSTDISRSLNFWIFTEAVIGYASINSMYFGILWREILPLQNSRTDSSSDTLFSF